MTGGVAYEKQFCDRRDRHFIRPIGNLIFPFIIIYINIIIYNYRGQTADTPRGRYFRGW